LRISGEIFKRVLENGVSKYPNYDGRWPIVSGIRFTFDPSREPGDRILRDSLKMLSGENLDMDKSYVLSCTYYMAVGKDGYDCLRDPSVEWLVNVDDCPTLQ